MPERPLMRVAVGRHRDDAVFIGAALSIAAALIHLWVVPAHLAEWWGYGAAFIVIGWIQGLYAPLLLHRPTQFVAVTGICMNLVVICIYVASRTSGIPVGPHAEAPELAGVLDLSATVLELGTVVALLVILEGAARRRMLNVLAASGLLMWAARVAGILW